MKGLCIDEINLMIQIFGKIVTSKQLEGFLEWDAQEYKKELETQREFLY